MPLLSVTSAFPGAFRAVSFSTARTTENAGTTRKEKKFEKSCKDLPRPATNECRQLIPEFTGAKT